MDSQNSNQRLLCAMKINVGHALNIQPYNRLDVNNLQSFCKWCINNRELKAVERTYRRSMSTESLQESNISRVAFGMPASPPNHASNTQNWNPCDNFDQTNHETWKGLDCIVFDKRKHQSSRVFDLTTFILGYIKVGVNLFWNLMPPNFSDLWWRPVRKMKLYLAPYLQKLKLDWIHPQQAYIYPEAAKEKRKINTAHTILENRHVAFILNMESWISGHDLTCPWPMTIKTSWRKFKFLQFILVMWNRKRADSGKSIAIWSSLCAVLVQKEDARTHTSRTCNLESSVNAIRSCCRSVASVATTRAPSFIVSVKSSFPSATDFLLSSSFLEVHTQQLGLCDAHLMWFHPLQSINLIKTTLQSMHMTD